MKITKCMVIIPMCIVGCMEGKVTPPRAADRQSAINTTSGPSGNERMSFGAFSFLIPDGWSAVTPDREKTKAMLLPVGATMQDAKALIKVDVGLPAAPTASKLAETFAKNAGGSVVPETMDFDGTAGVCVTTSSQDLATPRNMIIIFRNDTAYLLMVGAGGDWDASGALTRIRETWKWTEPGEAPVGRQP